MWRPPNSIRCAWAMDIESIVAFELLVVLESSMEQPYPFSPKDHLHRPRRAPLGPNYACTKTSAEQMSRRPQIRHHGWSRARPWEDEGEWLGQVPFEEEEGNA
jgi:hypothetical protein